MKTWTPKNHAYPPASAMRQERKLALFPKGDIRRLALAYQQSSAHDRTMATSRKTLDYTVEQVAAAGVVAARPMFGEFGLYCDGKMIAIIGDEKLFIKPTTGGRALAKDAVEVSPYPGAKRCLLIDADRWEDRDWMTDLVRITTAELPIPKRKPAKSPKDAK